MNNRQQFTAQWDKITKEISKHVQKAQFLHNKQFY